MCKPYVPSDKKRDREREFRIIESIVVKSWWARSELWKRREKQRGKTGTMIGDAGFRAKKEEQGATRYSALQMAGKWRHPINLTSQPFLTRECYFHPSTAGIRITSLTKIYSFRLNHHRKRPPPPSVYIYGHHRHRPFFSLSIVFHPRWKM